MNLSTIWQGYQADKQIEGYSPKTLKAYQLQSTLLIRYLGDVQIKKITTERLKHYLSTSTLF